MPAVGWWLWDGSTIRFEEAREEAEREGHFAGVPYPVLLALEEQHRRVDGAWLSPSGALECPRLRLRKRGHDYFVRLDWSWAAMVGTAVHNRIAAVLGDQEHVLSEQKLRTEVPVLVGSVSVPVLVEGTVDCFFPSRGLLIDFKTTSRSYAEPPLEHVIQVNLYRFLLEQNGYRVREARLWYAIPGLQSGRLRSVLHPVPLFPEQELLVMVHELAEPYARYLALGEEPACRCMGRSMVYPNLCEVEDAASKEA